MTTTTHASSPTLATPFLGRPIEICIVTTSLKTTLNGLLQLGIGPFKIFHFTPDTVSEQTFHGQPSKFSIDVAFAEQSGMVWEVMQPIEEPSIMQEYLESTGGRGGVQHVAFDCDGGGNGLAGEKAREEAVRRKQEFERRGFLCIQSGLWHGKKGTCEFMFFDTQGAIGTCFETYVFSHDWEEQDDVEIYPPPPDQQ